MTIVPSVGHPTELIDHGVALAATPDPWSGVNLPSPGLIILAVLALGALAGLAQLLYRAAIPPKGFASAWQIYRHMSARAARRTLPVTRPSLVGRRNLTVNEYSYRMGRSLTPFMEIRGNAEDSALFVGPPGVGKSASLGDIAVDAPGAMVQTTSKIADHDLTVGVRATLGPTAVFNPLGLGGVPSTLRINLVRGCTDLDVAIRRAAALLYGARGSGDSGDITEYFASNACQVLKAYLLAADLNGGSLLDVQRWSEDPKSPEAAKILIAHDAPTSWIETLRARQKVTERTRDGIFTTLSTALSWVASPAAVHAVTPTPEEDLDLTAFLRQRGSLYMVAESSAATTVAPLFTLILDDLVEAAVRLADRQPGRRLDPWMTMVLDEVATICPVPLDKWINKLRGHGILLLAGVQSKAQLYERWGKSGGDAIWNAAAATIVYGGLKSADDLRELSLLCGEREVVRSSVQHTAHGPVRSEHDELRPVLPPHKIRNLKKRRALVLYRSLPPVIVRVRRVWRRADVKRLARIAQRPVGPAPSPGDST